MEEKVKILKAVLNNEISASAENLAKAFDADLIATGAVETQTRQVETTLKILSQECDQVSKMIKRRQKQLEKLSAYNPPNHRSNDLPGIHGLDKIKTLISKLSEGYFAPLDLGSPHEINVILWKLVEVTLKNEQLVVAANLKIVQYLVNEGLVRFEQAATNSLRIRLF